MSYSLGPISVQPIPGKGYGVIASRRIEPGEPVFAERPLVQVHRDLKNGAVTTAVGNGCTWKEAQAELQQLSQCSIGTTGVERAINANGFVFLHPQPATPCRRDIPDEETGALCRETIVFKNISRVNHSCVPNCTFTWYPNEKAAVVRAAQAIAVGEEVTINYGATGTYTERQRVLQGCFHFTCTCAKCSAEIATEKQKDRRLAEVDWMRARLRAAPIETASVHERVRLAARSSLPPQSWQTETRQDVAPDYQHTKQHVRALAPA